jgi:metal-responsive CopG/Arc/MetJ family transcriptional regulator
MRPASRIIQVPVPEDLLRQLDEISEQRGQSRSALIREACASYLAKRREEELARQYTEGYRKFPEDAEDDSWAEIGEKELARRLAEDEW